MAVALAFVSGRNVASAPFPRSCQAAKQYLEAGHSVMQHCNFAASDNYHICTRVCACQVRPTISMLGIAMQARRPGGQAVTGATWEVSVTTWATTRPDGTPRASDCPRLGNGLPDLEARNPRRLCADNLELDPHPSELRKGIKYGLTCYWAQVSVFCCSPDMSCIGVHTPSDL